MKSLVKFIIRILPKKIIINLTDGCFRIYCALVRQPRVQDTKKLSGYKSVNEVYENCIQNFALDVNSDIQISNILTNQLGVISWGHSETTYNKYVGIILRKNQKIQIARPVRFENSWLRLSFAPAFGNISVQSYILKLKLRDIKNNTTSIADLYVYSNSTIDSEWNTFLIDLQAFNGQNGYLQLIWELNNSNIQNSDELTLDCPIIVSKITIGLREELELLEARTFRDSRIRNEVGHFSEVYTHKMYDSKQFESQEFFITQLGEIAFHDDEKQVDTFLSLQPMDHESIYNYASRLLDSNLNQKLIDFEKRLTGFSKSKTPVRILSLCSGSARTEARFNELTNNSLHWTLQDLNSELLKKARKQFHPSASVEFLVGDINTVSFSSKKWDIIMCVSGLHHIVELEKVLKFVENSLAAKGEFWVIGEYVGKSGNRLNAKAQKRADELFQKIPAKYRFNSHTKKVDSYIPKNDYSIDCFEGIRADEIEGVISKFFVPIEIVKNNSFLWRLVNLAYADNYSLEVMEDLNILNTLVEAEVAHFTKYLDGTTLNAVYRKLN
jgi:ubiquinone/menaquinone biosynthesis C-methylase UbiE